MSKEYFLSDTHFWHRNIIGYANREFDTIEAMNQFMVYKWNSVVTKHDTIIFGGDFAFATKEKQKELLSKLNGKEIILVKGNHDSSNKYMKEVGFSQVVKVYETDKYVVRHDPLDFTAKEIISRKFLLYGHLHQKFWDLPRAFNICVEPLAYTPHTLDQLIQLYKG